MEKIKENYQNSRKTLSMIKQRKNADMHVSAAVSILCILFIFLLFAGLGYFLSTPEKKLDYSVLAENFQKKSAKAREETVIDQSNFGQEDQSSQFIPRLDYNVSIKEERIDYSSGSSSEEEEEDSDSKKENNEKENNQENNKDSSGKDSYTLSCDMNVRSSPGLEGSIVKTIPQGTKVEILQTSRQSDGSLWGKVEGGWICISTKNATYLN